MRRFIEEMHPWPGRGSTVLTARARDRDLGAGDLGQSQDAGVRVRKGEERGEMVTADPDTAELGTLGATAAASLWGPSSWLPRLDWGTLLPDPSSLWLELTPRTPLTLLLGCGVGSKPLDMEKPGEAAPGAMWEAGVAHGGRPLGRGSP